MQDVIVERLTDRTEGLRSLALLRMSVFRDWPYLYDGDDAHEEAYLREFLASEQAALILARVDDMPVGMATASPLADQPESLTGPLAAAGVEIDAGFYFGESVLLPKFRGFGIGHKFFEAREAAARDAGARHAVFCAVKRDPLDARRPSDARDLAPFWHGRGYTMLEGAVCHMSWKEVGHADETSQLMQFWLKTL